jgi:hypothetical protein
MMPASDRAATVPIMSMSDGRSTGPQLRSGPLIAGAALVGAGGLLALAGLIVGGSHVLRVIRRQVASMDVPPSELARQKLAQAKAATAAGVGAWQNTPADSRASVS